MFDFSSSGGLGINFWVRIQLGQALSGINLWIREPSTFGCCCHCCCCCCCAGWWAGCPLAAWGEWQLWVLTRVLPSIREATLSYPLAIFTNSMWMPQRKGLKGMWEEAFFRAAYMDAPRASSQLRPLPLPMPLQLFMVPLLSSQPLSWGQGLQEQGSGVHNQGTLGAHF